MRLWRSRQKNRGLTLLDVVIVIFVVGLVAVLLLSMLAEGTRPNPRIHCLSNLKQVGLASRMWANDHGDQFPWQVSMAKGGTLELAESPEVFRHFLVLSNELSSPKVLHCAKDTKRTQVANWSLLRNQRVSYFIGLDADESRPQSILSGDRNITGGVLSSNGIVRFDANSQVGWGSDIYNAAGNVGLADGSAMQTTPNDLHKQIQADRYTKTNVSAIRLAIPR